MALFFLPLVCYKNERRLQQLLSKTPMMSPKPRLHSFSPCSFAKVTEKVQQFISQKCLQLIYVLV